MSDDKSPSNFPVPPAPAGTPQSEHEAWCHLPLSEHAAKIEALSGQERVGAVEALIARLMKLLDGWGPKSVSSPIPAEFSPFTIGPSESFYWDPLMHRNGADDGFDPRWALYRTALRLTQILGEERMEKNLPVSQLVDRWPVLFDRLPARQLKNDTEDKVRKSEAKQAELYPIRRTAFRTLDALHVGANHLFRPGQSKRNSLVGHLIRTYVSQIYILQKRPQNVDDIQWANNLGKRVFDPKSKGRSPNLDWERQAITLPPLCPNTYEQWIDVILLAIRAKHPNGLLNPSLYSAVTPDGYDIWDIVQGIVNDKKTRRAAAKKYTPDSKQDEQDVLDAMRIVLRDAMKTHLQL